MSLNMYMQKYLSVVSAVTQETGEKKERKKEKKKKKDEDMSLCDHCTASYYSVD